MNSIAIGSERARPTDLRARLQASCATCNLRELCVPGGITSSELEQLDPLVATRRRVRRGEALFRVSDAFDSLYAVRSGFFKTRLTSEDGRDQVTGFQMPGELLGLDGVATETHTVDAVALQDSEVCVLQFADLERIAREFSPLQHQLHRVMSREIVREHGVMVLLGSMRAEERVAAFLLNLSRRFETLGYSPLEFNLRMTREEIGSYLGLKLETVSRTLSRFQSDGLIEVANKRVRLIDLAALRALLSPAPC
ncbi:MAG: helix-turn-helix domain-containing protein [Burkholderiaceae bacterium]